MTVVAPVRTAFNLAEEVGLLVFLVGVVAMIVCFRRSSREQRLQLKWFMYASVVTAAVILAVAQVSNNLLPEFEIVFPLIPAAVGVAILKYRLYEIDRLISRTLAYAIVTGLLVGVYTGLVLLTTQAFRVHTPVAVAASTLARAYLGVDRQARTAGVTARHIHEVPRR